MSAPFSEGDRVLVVHGDYYALVLKAKRDRYGYDVLVVPETGGDPRWVGEFGLRLIRPDAG
jgi:hypothetical protein